MGTAWIRIFLLSVTVCLISSIKGDEDSPNLQRQKRESESTDNFKIVCYYPNWSQYRPGIGNFIVDNIDANLCTHIIYAFAKIVDNELATYEWNDPDTYVKFNALKQTNSNLKTLLSVGGYTLGVDPFRAVSATPVTRTAFSENVITYLRNSGFDGLDVDWEFPEASDREQYTELLKELKSQFDSESARTGNAPLLLSCALGAVSDVINNGYDLQTIKSYIDFGNVMAYDLHGAWDALTGFHSALHGYEVWDEFAQKWVVEEYIKNGFPTEKMVLGIPTYGRSYTLCDAENNGIRQCSSGNGHKGPYTQNSGTLAYYEICLNVASGWSEVYDGLQMAPYATSGNQWVSYDNVASVKEKATYVKTQSLGGAMFWDLSTDDFSDQCGAGVYPLVNAAKSVLITEMGTTTSATATTGRAHSCTGAECAVTMTTTVRSTSRRWQTSGAQCSNLCDVILATTLPALAALIMMNRT